MQDRSATYLRSIIRYCTDIGELVKKLRESGFTYQYPHVPWDEIAGLRNRIAHGYDTIDLEMVFDISVSDIPELQANCEYIMKQIEKK